MNGLSLKEILEKKRVLIENAQHITWSREEWLAFVDERAGILEHDAGIAPKLARVLALREAVALLDNNIALMEVKHPALRRSGY